MSDIEPPPTEEVTCKVHSTGRLPLMGFYRGPLGESDGPSGRRLVKFLTTWFLTLWFLTDRIQTGTVPGEGSGASC